MPVAQDADPMEAIARAPRRDYSRALDALILVIGLLVVWQLGTLLLGREALPSPAATVSKLVSIMSDEDFPRHAWETGRAFFTALLISLIAGLVIGLALGAHRPRAKSPSRSLPHSIPFPRSRSIR